MYISIYKYPSSRNNKRSIIIEISMKNETYLERLNLKNLHLSRTKHVDTYTIISRELYLVPNPYGSSIILYIVH